jgi:hypothetical protein
MPPIPFKDFEKMIKKNPKLSKKSKEKAIRTYRRKYYKIRKRI